MKNLIIPALVLAILGGCTDADPETSSDAARRINRSGSGLVQVIEHGKERAVAKYLTPEYLATTEVENRGHTGLSLDSLRTLYGRTISFHFSVSGESAHRIGMDSSGVVDPDATRNMFRLESGGNVWYPLCALPESRVGEADQSWFVVFPVDARKELKDCKTIAVIYTPLEESGEAKRFTYNVEDLLSPEFIAINN